MSAHLRLSSHEDFGRNASCPGELVNLTCTVNSMVHIWTIKSESMPAIRENVVIDDMTSNVYPLTISAYTFDGYKINRSLIVTYVTVIATNGTINVTCSSNGVTQSAHVEFAGWLLLL